MVEIQRIIEDRVVLSLESFPAVYIAGPRQSGKTTLARRIANSRHLARYVTFDDVQSLTAAKRDPEAFLRGLNSPVVLDEIQMAPELFRPLKIIIDENRAKTTKGRGQFLLTGSASVMALPKLSDALVGRIALNHLLPFSLCEIYSDTASSNFISRAFNNNWDNISGESYSITELITKSSYPELLYIDNEDMRYEWCNSYLNTILQRDVRLLMEVEKIMVLPDMLKILASRSGGILNESALSRATDLNHITSKKYRTLLENLFLTLTIPPWSANLAKRLVKSPKIYLGDMNLLAYLLNSDIAKLFVEHSPARGKILENFVAIELTKQLTFSSTRAKLYHYRTDTGQEVDFLLEGPDGKIVGIEVKSTTKVSTKDFRHLVALQSDLGERFHSGFLFYHGEEVTHFGEGLIAIPYSALYA